MPGWNRSPKRAFAATTGRPDPTCAVSCQPRALDAARAQPSLARMVQRSSLASIMLALGLAACSSSHGAAGAAATTGGTGASPSSSATSGSSTGGSSGSATSSGGPAPDGGLGPAQLPPGDLDPPSDGATITFEQIGAAGSFPSLRNPATGPCDAYDANGCCLATESIPGDALTPWDEELIMTLRGPISVKQLAVYQPASGDPTQWELVSGWDSREAASAQGITFDGDATPNAAFAGDVGSECLVNVSTAMPFACGAGSLPYCPSSSTTQHYGWAGSKLFVILASMPHAGTGNAAAACSTTTTGNWYDASWVGLSVGELVRAGAFSFCQCYAKDPTMGSLANGCGQFNVFEVVNDNDASKNLDVFSTDMIDYAGYVGQGPCGPACAVSGLAPAVDLIDKTTDTAATQGAVATPAGGPTAAFRRPESGYRYFVIAMDVASRTVQLGMVHPEKIPASISGLLPDLPAVIPQAQVNAVLGLRLPK
jgi:Glycine-rich protein domain (DUF2403)/Putative TOS1-like glycosyl hydrolase (DUF2401)